MANKIRSDTALYKISGCFNPQEIDLVWAVLEIPLRLHILGKFLPSSGTIGAEGWRCFEQRRA